MRGCWGNLLKIFVGMKRKIVLSKELESLFVPSIIRPSYGPGLLYTAPTTKNDDDAGQMLMVQELKRGIQKMNCPKKAYQSLKNEVCCGLSKWEAAI